MNNRYKKAESLRKKGLSYREISDRLNIPKSTISYWFRDKQWSQDVRRRLSRRKAKIDVERVIAMNKAREKKRKKLYKDYRAQAYEAFNKYKNNKLFISGLMLYWAEGDSKLENSLVRLSNTDPRIINIFIEFLKKFLDIDEKKIKLSLVIYPDLDDGYCKKFWFKKTGLPLDNFIKSQVIIGRHPTRRLKYGICTVYNCSRESKEKIMKWIDMCAEDIMRE